jgi:hypothetical protein
MVLEAWLRNVAAAALLLFPLSVHAQSSFQDDGGRAVAVPAQVEKVWPAGPPAEALV